MLERIEDEKFSLKSHENWLIELIHEFWQSKFHITIFQLFPDEFLRSFIFYISFNSVALSWNKRNLRFTRIDPIKFRV